MQSAIQQMRDRFQRLVDAGHAVLGTKWHPGGGGVVYIGPSQVDRQSYARWRAQAEAALVDAFGETNAYTRAFTKPGSDSTHPTAQAQVGVLEGVLDAIDHGELSSFASLLIAEVFVEFLDMADHLHANGYALPAASLAGAVLEDALRKLCTSNAISYNKRDGIDSLNQKLATASPPA